MYFEDNLPSDWNLEDAFLQYYDKCGKDFQKTLLCIKSDLLSLSVKPTVLKSVKTAAENHVTRWNKLSAKFKSYAAKEAKQEEVGKEGGSSNNQEQPSQQAAASSSSSTSNITNNTYNNTINEQATLNQTIVNNNLSGSSNNTKISNKVPNNRGKKRQMEEEEKPFLFEKVDPNIYESDIKSWKINNIDVGLKFKNYQHKIAKNTQTKNMHVETDTHEILAISNVLLIKNKQESSTYKEFFTEYEVELIEEEVKKKFGISNSYRFESSTKSTIDDIIFDLRQNKINTKSATKQLTAMLSEEDDNKSDVLILGIRNLIESLPRSKFNGPLRESNLSCSYVHCVLNPIFTVPEKNTHLMWLNTQIVKESDKQPDFVGNILVGSQFEGPAVVGDVKGEDRRYDISPCLIDLIRIGILSGQSINENKYNGVIGVHVVGVQVTCYVISLMAPGFYVMLELCSISLPKDFTEIRSYIANVEDLLPVSYCYDKCTDTLNDDYISINARKMMDSSTFKVITDGGKDRKRPCSIVYNH